MSSNYKKRPMIGVAMIIIAIVVFLISVAIQCFINNKIAIDTTDLIFSISIALVGVLMFFINIKSYGWAITFLICLSGIIANVIESKTDSMIILIIAAILSLGMLIYKNIRIQNKTQQ